MDASTRIVVHERKVVELLRTLSDRAKQIAAESAPNLSHVDCLRGIARIKRTIVQAKPIATQVADVAVSTHGDIAGMTQFHQPVEDVLERTAVVARQELAKFDSGPLPLVRKHAALPVLLSLAHRN